MTHDCCPSLLQDWHFICLHHIYAAAAQLPSAARKGNLLFATCFSAVKKMQIYLCCFPIIITRKIEKYSVQTGFFRKNEGGNFEVFTPEGA